MNSRVGLIIVYLSISVPYAIWLLVGFFQTVPLEIEEAAYMMVRTSFKYLVVLSCRLSHPV